MVGPDKPVIPGQHSFELVTCSSHQQGKLVTHIYMYMYMYQQGVCIYMYVNCLAHHPALYTHVQYMYVHKVNQYMYNVTRTHTMYTYMYMYMYIVHVLHTQETQIPSFKVSQP